MVSAQSLPSALEDFLTYKAISSDFWQFFQQTSTPHSSKSVRELSGGPYLLEIRPKKSSFWINLVFNCILSGLSSLKTVTRERRRGEIIKNMGRKTVSKNQRDKKKWKKGESCVSNPTNRKFRDGIRQNLTSYSVKSATVRGKGKQKKTYMTKKDHRSHQN